MGHPAVYQLIVESYRTLSEYKGRPKDAKFIVGFSLPSLLELCVTDGTDAKAKRRKVTVQSSIHAIGSTVILAERFQLCVKATRHIPADF